MNDSFCTINGGQWPKKLRVLHDVEWVNKKAPPQKKQKKQTKKLVSINIE